MQQPNQLPGGVRRQAVNDQRKRIVLDSGAETFPALSTQYLFNTTRPFHLHESLSSTDDPPTEPQILSS